MDFAWWHPLGQPIYVVRNSGVLCQNPGRPCPVGHRGPTIWVLIDGVPTARSLCHDGRNRPRMDPKAEVVEVDLCEPPP